LPFRLTALKIPVMKQRDNDNIKSGSKLCGNCGKYGGKTSSAGYTYKHAYCSLVYRKRFVINSLSKSGLKKDKIIIKEKNSENNEHLQTYFAKRLKKAAYLCCLIFAFIFFIHLFTSHFAISSINPEKSGGIADQSRIRQTIRKRIKIEPLEKNSGPFSIDNHQKNESGKNSPEKANKAPAKKHKAVNISRVWNAGRNISITFDGGADASSARQILDILKKNKIKTTFFLSGIFIDKYRDLTRRIVDDGHEVGNHTFTHPHLTTYGINRKQVLRPGVTFKRIRMELDKTARLFKEVTGREMSPLWRAPYGEINGAILRWAALSGYQHIAWTYNRKTRKSMDSLDWVSDRRSPFYHSAEEIKKRLTSFIDDDNSANGGIVLMHLGTERKEDVVHEKLDEIINSFVAKGYDFVPVSQLIKLKNQI